MPELPDLEIIIRRLAPRLTGAAITDARAHRPTVLRNLLGGDMAPHLVGRCFAQVSRRGKFLLLPLADGPTLVINPMLAGRLRYGQPLPRDRARDALILQLEDGHELRYHDAVDMGKVYLTNDLAQVPTYAEQGPDADDPALTLEAFRERLRTACMPQHHGEIKGILTNQAFVAGIGNAYADEICWAAGLYPFRRRASLSGDDVARLHRVMGAVLEKAIAALEERVGDAAAHMPIDVEIRDFLAVHGKPGEPCPRCGSPISEVTRERRATNFCRSCQPGLLVGNN